MTLNDVTVIVPTIPEREVLFDQALDSVMAQTAPCFYKTAVDQHHNGPAATVNALVDCVETEWFVRLDDDDLLDPDYIEIISKWLDDDADIVYSWCRIEGGGELHPPDQFQVRWQAMPGGWSNLYERNWIPCTAAVRTSLHRDLGGLRDVEEEDWEFWQRALEGGAVFRCVPTATWTYRMNPEWEHRSQ